MDRSSWALVLLLAVVVVERASAGLPSYIIPCSASDPKFNECCLRTARSSMKRFAQGDKENGIPPLEPLFAKEIRAIGGKGDGLKVYLQDVKLIGTSDLEMKKFRIDIPNKRVSAKVKGDLKLDATYDLSGRILIIPLYGKGHALVDLEDVKLTYVFNFDYITKNDGKQYINMLNDTLKYDIGKAAFNLENLFNGDRVLGESTLRLLNESWKEIINEVGPPVAKILKEAFHNTIKKFLLTVPHDELILP